MRALTAQVLQHKRFEWAQKERERLISLNRNQQMSKDQIDCAVMCRVIHDCENTVLYIMQRTFVEGGWVVRAKTFDGLIVEPSISGGCNSNLEDLMRDTEELCLSEGGFDVRLREKPLFGMQDQSWSYK
jgi:hypothetical protein